jgi:hypothetical protein
VDALARFPIRWNHLIEKNSRQFKNLGSMSLSEKRVHFSGTCSRAFSSEVDSGSRKENASKQKARSRSAIDSKNLERDAGGKTLHTFPHPAREPVPEDSVAQLDRAAAF